MGWQPIETAPMGQLIDVWCWELGEDGAEPTGFRWTDVRLRDGGDPTLMEVNIREDDDGEQSNDYYPHENGQWVSHWMPLPEPPATTHNGEGE